MCPYILYAKKKIYSLIQNMKNKVKNLIKQLRFPTTIAITIKKMLKNEQ